MFSKKKAFLIFQETETLKNFRKAEALKKRLILHEIKSNFLASGLRKLSKLENQARNYSLEPQTLLHRLLLSFKALNNAPNHRYLTEF